ncbi:MAG: NADH-quinone oxidoreductase subunit NuoE family protein [Thermodesulfobacteriota bacterium]
MCCEERKIREEVQELLQKFQATRENLIPILQEMQGLMGYLPLAGTEEVARYLSIPVGEVYGVATFYNQFRLTPPGKYQIKVCTGTACHVKRSYVILEEWERRLGIREGETTPDRLFSLEKVACVGCCALAPVVVIRQDSQETFYGNMMTSRVNGLILEVERKEGHGSAA